MKLLELKADILSLTWSKTWGSGLDRVHPEQNSTYQSVQGESTPLP